MATPASCSRGQYCIDGSIPVQLSLPRRNAQQTPSTHGLSPIRRSRNAPRSIVSRPPAARRSAVTAGPDRRRHRCGDSAHPQGRQPAPGASRAELQGLQRIVGTDAVLSYFYAACEAYESGDTDKKVAVFCVLTDWIIADADRLPEETRMEVLAEASCMAEVESPHGRIPRLGDSAASLLRFVINLLESGPRISHLVPPRDTKDNLRWQPDMRLESIVTAYNLHAPDRQSEEMRRVAQIAMRRILWPGPGKISRPIRPATPFPPPSPAARAPSQAAAQAAPIHAPRQRPPLRAASRTPRSSPRPAQN